MENKIEKERLIMLATASTSIYIVFNSTKYHLARIDNETLFNLVRYRYSFYRIYIQVNYQCVWLSTIIPHFKNSQIQQFLSINKMDDDLGWSDPQISQPLSSNPFLTFLEIDPDQDLIVCLMPQKERDDNSLGYQISELGQLPSFPTGSDRALARHTPSQCILINHPPPRCQQSSQSLQEGSPDSHQRENHRSLALKPQTSLESASFQPRVPQNKQKKPNKGDIRKNIYGNTIKTAIKAYISSNFQKTVRRIHQKLGITDPPAAKEFFRRRKGWPISFKDLFDLLEYREGSDHQRLFRKAFVIFYRWFMREKYSVHILEEKKIEHVQDYLQMKNYTIYLPDVELKGQNKASGHSQLPMHADGTASNTEGCLGARQGLRPGSPLSSDD